MPLTFRSGQRCREIYQDGQDYRKAEKKEGTAVAAAVAERKERVSYSEV